MIDALNRDLSALVEGIRGSLVEVRPEGGGAGSGIVWRSDGLILTNAHVARGRSGRVRLADGRTVPARLVARDERADLALLAAEAGGLLPCAVGDARLLRPGEWVFALGHPFGVPGALTAGVVIGVGPAEPGFRALRGDWILADLHLRPGHSGGPLCDARGRLVGVNTMVTGRDIGMAVPVHRVHHFVARAL